MLNITSGIYRSRKLEFDEKDINLRPTKNNVRNALFSILNKDIKNSYFLDMFGGTGSIGIEAISNNAKKVYFFENDKKHYDVLKRNINQLKIETSKYEILFLDALENLSKIENKMNIIFVDPPYKKYEYHEILNKIFQSKILNSETIIIFESEKNLFFPDYWFDCKIYKYGRVYLTKIWNIKRK